MQLHTLKSHTKSRRGQRIGRGGKRGTTSGRGTKGQKARAGHKIRPELRDILKRIPKLRGYKFRSFRKKPVVISLANVERVFSKGETVTREKLVEKSVVRKRYGKIPAVKILGATISKPLSIVGLYLSKGARAAILKAGGTIQ
ncbi:MAG: uL15 family ribosomal protein [Candidatus Sungbacteria bacterium]|nr:uL15 family ribosomal protein [Candidatus Sungbacteria bacterium]